MRKLIVAVVVVAFGWLALGLSGTAQEGKAKYTIKQVMKTAHAKMTGLKDKVIAGTASAEEKKSLLEHYEALAASKPPKGSDADWKTKTAALVAAAKDAVDGKEGAADKLRAASNCAACHGAHKGA
jgi:hypothetical protein